MSTRYQPKKAWSITILLSIFMLVNFVDKVVIGLVAVPMMAEFKMTAVEFGVVAGSFFWLFAIAGVIGGFMANRVKTKWFLLAMAIIWSIVQLPIIFSSSIFMIIAARVLLGASEGPAWPVSIHACYKWFPDDKRNLPVSIIAQGPTIGLLLAGISVPLISAHWGWRANFIVLGLIGLVWGALWLVIGAEGPIDSRAAAQDGGAKVSQRRIAYRRLLTDRTIVTNFLLHFVAYWGLALTLTWLPSYLEKGLGYDSITSGRMFALVIVLCVPINVGLSWWSQRLLARGASSRTARAIFASVGLVTAGLLFSSLVLFEMSSLQKVIVVAIATGLTPIIYSLGPAMLGEVTPVSQRGAILAIDNSIASLAGMLAPMVTGRLVQMASGSVTAGYEQGFAVSGLLLIGGGLFGLLWANPEKSSAQLMAPNVATQE